MEQSTRVLIAEDQDLEMELYKRALASINMPDYCFVRDGEQAVQYLKGEGQYSDRQKFPFPIWLLLDLKMPRMDGLEVLHWVRQKPCCKIVPTVMFSNSGREQDIVQAYELGANAYFVKPARFEEMVSILALIAHFWQVAQHPPIDPSLKCH